MNSGAAFSQIRRVIDLERRCFFSARWRGDRKIKRLADVFEVSIDKLIGEQEQAVEQQNRMKTTGCRKLAGGK